MIRILTEGNTEIPEDLRVNSDMIFSCYQTYRICNIKAIVIVNRLSMTCKICLFYCNLFHEMNLPYKVAEMLTQYQVHPELCNFYPKLKDWERIKSDEITIEEINYYQ